MVVIGTKVVVVQSRTIEARSKSVLLKLLTCILFQQSKRTVLGDTMRHIIKTMTCDSSYLNV